MSRVSIKNFLELGWPFWVLELSSDADVKAVERSYNKLTSLLEFDSAGAGEYLAPDGIKIRDAFLLREARDILLSPEKRVLAEFWYVDPEKHQFESQRESADVDRWKNMLGL